jgi:hypothetical protein
MPHQIDSNDERFDLGRGLVDPARDAHLIQPQHRVRPPIPELIVTVFIAGSRYLHDQKLNVLHESFSIRRIH